MQPLLVRQLYTRLRDANPAPRTELHYDGPFQLLVAVMLSAQATDVSVNKATARLFPLAPTPAALLALGEEGLAEAIRTIGLYRSKARHVIATCRILLEHHGGEVPARREALEALPGVGRKTANVVLNTAFGQHAGYLETPGGARGGLDGAGRLAGEMGRKEEKHTAWPLSPGGRDGTPHGVGSQGWRRQGCTGQSGAGFHRAREFFFPPGTGHRSARRQRSHSGLRALQT